MPVLDYETFEFATPEAENALSLDQAITKAASLRAKDPNLFYRIVPSGGESIQDTFQVRAIPKDQVYSEILSRFARRLAAIYTRRKK